MGKKRLFSDIGGVRHDIQELYKKLGSWRSVGLRFGISPAMAWRIAKQGYEPKDPEVRKSLNLKLFFTAAACGACGKVHTTLRCVDGRRKKRYRSLYSWPVEELRQAIENRVEMR